MVTKLESFLNNKKVKWDGWYLRGFQKDMEGLIIIENGKYYFLHNYYMYEGNKPYNMKGFKYSYCLSDNMFTENGLFIIESKIHEIW